MRKCAQVDITVFSELFFLVHHPNVDVHRRDCYRACCARLAVPLRYADMCSRRRADVGLPYTAPGWYGKLQTTHYTRVRLLDDEDSAPDVMYYHRLVYLNEHLKKSRVKHLDDY